MKLKHLFTKKINKLDRQTSYPEHKQKVLKICGPENVLKLNSYGYYL